MSSRRGLDPLGRPISRPVQQNRGYVTPGALNASQVDVKEILKNRIGDATSNYSSMDSNSSSVTDTNTAAQSANVTSYGFEDYEIFLDSTARDQISDIDAGVLQWSLTPYNGGQELRNVMEMFIGPFLFPRIQNASGSAPDFFYFNRVFIEVINTPTQNAVIAPNNTKFHFECEVGQINAQAVELIPIKKTFFFRRPLDSLGLLQLRFSVPSNVPNSLGGFNNIKIPKENVRVDLVAGSNPARFTITNGTTDLLAPIGTLPVGQGIAVFMRGASTGSQVLNEQINSPNGIYVTEIISTTEFTVGSIDAGVAVASPDITMYVPKNRIAFPIRISAVQPYTTNYVDVSRS